MGINIKEMTKIVKVLIVVSIILIGVLSFSFYKTFTGQTIGGYYTYTKAICNETNYCEDYEIVCDRENLISINPTGYAVKNPDDWEDPRSENERNNNGLCNVTD